MCVCVYIYLYVSKTVISYPYKRLCGCFLNNQQQTQIRPLCGRGVCADTILTLIYSHKRYSICTNTLPVSAIIFLFVIFKFASVLS